MQEIEVKDALVEKLKMRNRMLEGLMKKAVRIMKNPSIMQEAFRKFNFDRYIYSQDDSEVNVISTNHQVTNTAYSSQSKDYGEGDALSERLPNRKGQNRDLILVETQSQSYVSPKDADASCDRSSAPNMW